MRSDDLLSEDLPPPDHVPPDDHVSSDDVPPANVPSGDLLSVAG